MIHKKPDIKYTCGKCGLEKVKEYCYKVVPFYYHNKDIIYLFAFKHAPLPLVVLILSIS